MSNLGQDAQQVAADAQKAAQGIFSRFVRTIADNAKWVALAAIMLAALIVAHVVFKVF